MLSFDWLNPALGTNLLFAFVVSADFICWSTIIGVDAQLDGAALRADFLNMSDTFPRTGGCLRRLIDLRREEDGAVVGWLEDDFHHIGLTLENDGSKITGVYVTTIRLPFSACPMAASNLQQLVGQTMSARSTEIGTMLQMRQQCTHMFDLAGLAMALAARGLRRRRYEAVTEDREIVAWEAGHRRLLGKGEAWIMLDGAEVLRWRIEKRMITGPDRWSGQPLVEGFRKRTEGMDLDLAEAASVLRRAIMVSSGRTIDFEKFETAADRGTSGVCYAFQEENRKNALTLKGASRNYEDGSQSMLAHLAERPGPTAIDSKLESDTAIS